MSSGLTLGAARASLPSVCFPPGKNASAALLEPFVNAASSWLISEGLWRGTKQRMAFTVYDNQVTLPRGALCVLSAVVQGAGDNYRQQARYRVTNDWYSWIPSGPGIVTDPPYDVGGFVDRGDGFISFLGLPSAGQIKIVTSATETANTFHIRGLYLGEKVYTGTGTNRIEGENITMPTTLSGTATSVSTFDAGDSLYLVVKPLTNGVLFVYHTASGTDTLIARYEPGETLPNYRRYYCPQRSSVDNQVVALVKRKHVDVKVDNDEIIPGNQRALELAMQAVGFQRKTETGLADKYIADAIKELNAELIDFDSDASYGVAQLDPYSGMGRIANLV